MDVLPALPFTLRSVFTPFIYSKTTNFFTFLSKAQKHEKLQVFEYLFLSFQVLVLRAKRELWDVQQLSDGRGWPPAFLIGWEIFQITNPKTRPDPDVKSPIPDVFENCHFLG